MMARRAFALTTLLLAAVTGVGYAQLRGVTATVTPIVGTDGVHAGTEVRTALRVVLPAGFHVQSDQPRDPLLIPTVLTIGPVPGISVAELVYPAPTDFMQRGTEEPLAVFDRGLRSVSGWSSALTSPPAR